MLRNQPAPTKRFVVYHEGAWYSQGDTSQAAWEDLLRLLNPKHDRYGVELYREIVRYGKMQKTAITEGGTDVSQT